MDIAESNCTEQGESKKEFLCWLRCLQKSSLKTWVWIVLQGMANPEVGWKGQSASCASRDIDWKNYQPRVNLQIPTTSVPGRLVGSQEFKGTTVQFQGPNGRQITAILNRQWDHSLHKLQDKERESSQTLSTVWSKSKLLSKGTQDCCTQLRHMNKPEKLHSMKLNSKWPSEKACKLINIS